MDLALNNLQRLICHKTHQTKPDKYRAIIEKLVQQIPNDRPKFQEQLKKLKKKKNTLSLNKTKNPLHCLKNIHSKLQVSK